jgi:hypothetical protein
MVEQTQEEASQQPDSGRISTPRGRRQIMATLLGHQNNHRSGRQAVHRPHTVIMSEKELTEQFNRIERNRADTWGFVAFMAIMGLIGWINS